jgi:hypothetical protein
MACFISHDYWIFGGWTNNIGKFKPWESPDSWVVVFKKQAATYYIPSTALYYTKVYCYFITVYDGKGNSE